MGRVNLHNVRPVTGVRTTGKGGQTGQTSVKIIKEHGINPRGLLAEHIRRLLEKNSELPGYLKKNLKALAKMGAEPKKRQLLGKYRNQRYACDAEVALKRYLQRGATFGPLEREIRALVTEMRKSMVKDRGRDKKIRGYIAGGFFNARIALLTQESEIGGKRGRIKGRIARQQLKMLSHCWRYLDIAEEKVGRLLDGMGVKGKSELVLLKLAEIASLGNAGESMKRGNLLVNEKNLST